MPTSLPDFPGQPCVDGGVGFPPRLWVSRGGGSPEFGVPQGSPSYLEGERSTFLEGQAQGIVNGRRVADSRESVGAWLREGFPKLRC